MIEKCSKNHKGEGKRFGEWMGKKAELHKESAFGKFSEGEVWWAAVGENVGVEINGKHKDFSRPVVVFKKLSNLCFLAIPLTSQPHSGSWYVEFEFLGKTEWAVLCQIRMMSSARLYNRMGRLSVGDLRKMRLGLEKLIK